MNQYHKTSLCQRPLYLFHQVLDRSRQGSVSSRSDVPLPEVHETGSRASQDLSDTSSLRPESEPPKELGRIRFQVQLRCAADKPLCTLQVSLLKINLFLNFWCPCSLLWSRVLWTNFIWQSLFLGVTCFQL
jgi:hypothetical protein